MYSTICIIYQYRLCTTTKTMTLVFFLFVCFSVYIEWKTRQIIQAYLCTVSIHLSIIISVMFPPQSRCLSYRRAESGHKNSMNKSPTKHATSKVSTSQVSWYYQREQGQVSEHSLILCLLCRLGRVDHRQARRLSFHLAHVFKGVKRVSLTLLFAFTHALYWTGKLTKGPMCIKESLFYLQDKKYSFFTVSVVKWGKHALNLQSRSVIRYES